MRIDITGGGSGYWETPKIWFDMQTGVSSATGITTINQSGIVTQLTSHMGSDTQ